MKKLFSLFAVTLFTVAALLTGCGESAPAAADSLEKMAKYTSPSEATMYVSLDASTFAPFDSIIKSNLDADELKNYAAVMDAMPLSILKTIDESAVVHTPKVADLKELASKITDAGARAELATITGTDMLLIYADADSDTEIMTIANPEPNIFVVAETNAVDCVQSATGLDSAIIKQVKKSAEKRNIVVILPTNDQFSLALKKDGDIEFDIRSAELDRETVEMTIAQISMMIPALLQNGEITAADIAKERENVAIAEDGDVVTVSGAISGDFLKKLAAAAAPMIAQQVGK